MSNDKTRTLPVARSRRPCGASIERRSRSRRKMVALTILAHADPRRVGERAVLAELAAVGGSVDLSRLTPTFSQPTGGEGRPLDDPCISRTPVRLRSLPGDGLRLAASGRPGQLAVDGHLVDGEWELAAAAVERGAVLEVAGRAALLLHRIAAESSPRLPDSVTLVGESDAICRVREEILRVADLDVPVLLRGETGTGKDLAARAVHRLGRRGDAEYLSINLGAIPPSLAAAELFGAVKGAFTGAVKSTPGFFQRADGGTLFLDEVGEAPGEVQVMLLRALESGEIQQVGGTRPLQVDVRLIAATDSDLKSAIEAGRFREPLLHRLSGYEIVMPPLRQRRDDFGRLLFHFLHHELAEIGEARQLEPRPPLEEPFMPISIVARLARHGWPGNVRQLRNVARQMAIASRGTDRVQVTSQLEQLLQEAVAHHDEETVERPIPTGDGSSADAITGTWQRPNGDGDRVRRRPPPPPDRRKPSEISEEELLAALAANEYLIKPTAQALRVSRSSLYELIDRCPKVRKACDLSIGEIREAQREVEDDGIRALAAELEVSPYGLQQRLKELELD